MVLASKEVPCLSKGKRLSDGVFLNLSQASRYIFDLFFLQINCIALRISKFLFFASNKNGEKGNEIDEEKGRHEEIHEGKETHHEAPQSHESV